MSTQSFEQRENILINSLTKFAQEQNIKIRTVQDIMEQFSMNDVEELGCYSTYIIDDILSHSVKSQLNFVLFEKPQNFKNTTITNDAGNIYVEFNNINPELYPNEQSYLIWPGFEYESYSQSNKTLTEWETTLWDFLNNIFF